MYSNHLIPDSKYRGPLGRLFSGSGLLDWVFKPESPHTQYRRAGEAALSKNYYHDDKIFTYYQKILNLNFVNSERDAIAIANYLSQLEKMQSGKYFDTFIRFATVYKNHSNSVNALGRFVRIYQQTKNQDLINDIFEIVFNGMDTFSYNNKTGDPFLKPLTELIELINSDENSLNFVKKVISASKKFGIAFKNLPGFFESFKNLLQSRPSSDNLEYFFTFANNKLNSLSAINDDDNVPIKSIAYSAVFNDLSILAESLGSLTQKKADEEAINLFKEVIENYQYDDSWSHQANLLVSQRFQDLVTLIIDSSDRRFFDIFQGLIQPPNQSLGATKILDLAPHLIKLQQCNDPRLMNLFFEFAAKPDKSLLFRQLALSLVSLDAKTKEKRDLSFEITNRLENTKKLAGAISLNYALDQLPNNLVSNSNIAKIFADQAVKRINQTTYSQSLDFTINYLLPYLAKLVATLSSNLGENDIQVVSGFIDDFLGKLLNHKTDPTNIHDVAEKRLGLLAAYSKQFPLDVNEVRTLHSILNIVHDNFFLVISACNALQCSAKEFTSIFKGIPFNNTFTRIVRLLGEGKKYGGFLETISNFNPNQRDFLLEIIEDYGKRYKKTSTEHVTALLEILASRAQSQDINTWTKDTWDTLKKSIEDYKTKVYDLLNPKLFSLYEAIKHDDSQVLQLKEDLETELGNLTTGKFFGLSEKFVDKYNFSLQDTLALFHRFLPINSFNSRDYGHILTKIQGALKDRGLDTWQNEVDTSLRTGMFFRADLVELNYNGTIDSARDQSLLELIL